MEKRHSKYVFNMNRYMCNMCVYSMFVLNGFTNFLGLFHFHFLIAFFVIILFFKQIGIGDTEVVSWHTRMITWHRCNVSVACLRASRDSVDNAF